MAGLSDGRLRLICIAALLVLLILSGCAGSTKYGAVTITSDPAGAEVVNLKDDSNIGITPARVSFSGESNTAEYVTVQLRKKGYLDRIISFWVNRRHDNPGGAEQNAIDIHVELEKSKTN